MQKKDEDDFLRTLAAIRVSVDNLGVPDYLFGAHLFLFNQLLISPFRLEIKETFDNILRKTWLERTTMFQGAFNCPRVTVPDIQNACNNKFTGLKSSAKILLAVSNALSLRLSDEFIALLKKVANK
ncbi:MAG: hypothetical protein GX221_00450 [Candidatus Riflebacteria bacterium]|nr:hypothetical protein [Candidatus Riflebacteria bacterium]